MNIADIQQALGGIRDKYKTQGAGGGDMAYTEMANFIRQNNIDPNLVAEATGGGFAPNQWSGGQVQAQVNKYADAGAGLRPAISSIYTGMQDATGRINQTMGRVSGLFQEGIGRLDPYMQAGNKANDLQAALSGSLGREAQAQAFANYQQSPGVGYAQEMAEKALTRNASALGGLGGGNAKAELSRQAAGIFTQDYGNQFNQIGQVADRGYGASTTAAGMGAQEAGIQSSLGQFNANIPMWGASANAAMQFQAGRDISNNVSGITTALSSLQDGMGRGTADTIRGQATDLNTLYRDAMNGNAEAIEKLGLAMGNVNGNAAANVAGVPGTQMQPSNYLGQVGQIASGAAGIAYGMSQGTGGNTGGNSSTPAMLSGVNFDPNYTAPSFAPSNNLPRY